MMEEKIKVETVLKVVKFKDPDGKVAEKLRAGADLQEVMKLFPDRFIEQSEDFDNVILDEGASEIWKLVTGASADHFDSTNAQIGVGDGTTAEDKSQTDLQGTNTAYKGMDSGYPSVSGRGVTFRSTFDGTEANFDWNEFTVKHASSGINLNRKVISKGTKSSGETWAVSLTLTIR